MSKQTVSALNLQNALTNCKQRIYRIGVELEGGWTTLPPGAKDCPNGELVRDGSVSIDRNATARPRNWDGRRYTGNQLNFTVVRSGRNTYTLENDPNPGTIYSYDQAVEMGRLNDAGLNPFAPAPPSRILAGELPSRILQLSEVESWMKENYPQHVNESCGLHVHLSFRKALHYERLMTPEYQETVLDYLTKWAKDEAIPTSHHIWKRLKGENTYCKKDFFADEQVKPTNKNHNHAGASRYTAINYCHGQHGTIECRVLPMFDEVEQAYRAVRQVIDVTNACIKVLGKVKEKKLSASLISDMVNDVQFADSEEMV